MTVAHILEEKGSNVYSVAPSASVAEAAKLLTEAGIGALLALDESGGIHGVISERDIVCGLAERGAAILDEPVETLMTRDLHTTMPTSTVASVMELMTSRRVRHLPVLEDGKLVGLISIGDVVKHRIAEAQHEAEALKSYVLGG